MSASHDGGNGTTICPHGLHEEGTCGDWDEKVKLAIDLHYKMLHGGEWEDCQQDFCLRRMASLGLDDESLN